MKSFLIVVACAIAVLAVNGCATYDPARIDDMEYRLARLEKKVLPAPETETAAPAESTVAAAPEKEAETPAIVIPDAPTKMDIQQALKNAGYDPGAIDGKAGPLTKRAIKSFQRDHNLVADGVAGRKTWEKLYPYLKNPR